MDTADRSSGISAPSVTDKTRVRLIDSNGMPRSAGTMLEVVKNEAEGPRPVIYWMSRDQRADDNWALLYAAEVARKMRVPFAVCFCIVSNFEGATMRMYDFMLRGLEELDAKLERLNIPFFLLQGEPAAVLPGFAKSMGAPLIVTDFSPLRVGRQWREAVAKELGDASALHEVDAHNIVPVWVTSNKQEYAARTIRPKIHRKLPEYLTEFPALWEHAPDNLKIRDDTAKADWPGVRAAIRADPKVGPVDWIQPGETAALAGLTSFCEGRIRKYGLRNDPTVDACSNISPWLHFGHLSAQRAALAASTMRHKYSKEVASFLEELVVRKELSDNYCNYNDKYDSLDGRCDKEGNTSWAQATLDLHSQDARDHVYTYEQFERAETHEELWNAAQMEMVTRGKMSGFMRMYWAKKILEWSSSPEEAIRIAIRLNDRYELDGRDPNGYCGVMWAITGLHDQGWREREVFGKVRYMNLAGCKRKFDVKKYIEMHT